VLASASAPVMVMGMVSLVPSIHQDAEDCSPYPCSLHRSCSPRDDWQGVHYSSRISHTFPCAYSRPHETSGATGRTRTECSARPPDRQRVALMALDLYSSLPLPWPPSLFPCLFPCPYYCHQARGVALDSRSTYTLPRSGKTKNHEGLLLRLQKAMHHWSQVQNEKLRTSSPRQHRFCCY